MDPNQLPIETQSLIIRPFVAGDAAVLLDLSNEDAFRKWLPSQVYRDYAHALSALEFLISRYEIPRNPRHEPYVLGVEHRDDAVLIGHVGFSPLYGEVEIGFSIAQGYQRRGLAAEAIVAGSRWALRTFSLQRILAVTSAANIASRRSLERARFAHEGNRTMIFQGTEQEVSVYLRSGDLANQIGA